MTKTVHQLNNYEISQNTAAQLHIIVHFCEDMQTDLKVNFVGSSCSYGQFLKHTYKHIFTGNTGALQKGNSLAFSKKSDHAAFLDFGRSPCLQPELSTTCSSSSWSSSSSSTWSLGSSSIRSLTWGVRSRRKRKSSRQPVLFAVRRCIFLCNVVLAVCFLFFCMSIFFFFLCDP